MVLLFGSFDARLTMKRMMVLIAVVLALSCSTVAALTFSLTINEVTSTSVTGTLMIYNYSEQDVLLQFPTAGTFDLMVDGNEPPFVYPGIITELLIPAQSNISKGVSYVSSTPFTPGSHIARARYVMAGNPPAGNARTFYYGTPLTEVYDIQYQFSITNVSTSSVTGTLSMHNPHSQYWMMSFPYTQVAKIFVDGQPPYGLDYPMTVAICINPGQTHTEVIHHYSSSPYSVGNHIADARLFLSPDDVPVGQPQTFVVGPVDADDPIAPPLEPLSLKLSPNPCRGPLNIISSSKQPQTLSIYDLKGRKVFETVTDGDFTWDGRDTLHRHCPAGIYLVKASQGARTASQRFVKL